MGTMPEPDKECLERQKLQLEIDELKAKNRHPPISSWWDLAGKWITWAALIVSLVLSLVSFHRQQARELRQAQDELEQRRLESVEFALGSLGDNPVRAIFYLESYGELAVPVLAGFVSIEEHGTHWAEGALAALDTITEIGADKLGTKEKKYLRSVADRGFEELKAWDDRYVKCSNRDAPGPSQSMDGECSPETLDPAAQKDRAQVVRRIYGLLGGNDEFERFLSNSNLPGLTG